MRLNDLVSKVNALCDQRGIPAGADPVRIRMVSFAIEAVKAGKDPEERVRNQLSLLFDPQEFDANPTPASPVPPVIHGRRI